MATRSRLVPRAAELANSLEGTAKNCKQSGLRTGHFSNVDVIPILIGMAAEVLIGGLFFCFFVVDARLVYRVGTKVRPSLAASAAPVLPGQ